MIWEFRISYQVLAGSHHMGRVDHFLMGGQSGADPGRVEMAKKFGCQHLHVEMEPGDALFFHSNLLHTRSRMGKDLASNFLTSLIFELKKLSSDQNKSSMRRWVMISSYNQVKPGQRFFLFRRGTVPRSPITVLSTSIFIKFQIMR